MFEKIFRQQTDNTLIQLFRYTFVGGGAFVVDVGSLFIFTEYLGIHYLTSAAVAFILGLMTNYLLSVSWVFNRRTIGSRWAEFGIFALIGLIGLGLNEALIWSCTEYLGLHYLMSKIISTALIYIWNFSARKAVLFR
ncbi:GtrA family protein [Desulfonema ishimotonii]|uniref:GtrA family protein n=1 Tax=Desulfonema ishimotonii TaxID=45657 RepID=A0A401FUP5_9BACT|nr:GtrA family protein [Desulfonema ishimotonii]